MRPVPRAHAATRAFSFDFLLRRPGRGGGEAEEGMMAAAPGGSSPSQARPRGLHVDLGDTLYVGGPLPSAPEAVARLAREGIPRRFFTNTTRVSRTTLAGHLREMGFPVGQDELFTAPDSSSMTRRRRRSWWGTWARSGASRG